MTEYYHVAQNFDWGNFDSFELESQNLNWQKPLIKSVTAFIGP